MPPSTATFADETISVPAVPRRKTTVKKNSHRSDRCSAGAAQNVSDKRRSGKNRPRSKLANRDRVQQLLPGEPGMLLNKALLQKRQQHIPTAIKHCAYLQEEQADLPNRRPCNRSPSRNCQRCDERSF